MSKASYKDYIEEMEKTAPVWMKKATADKLLSTYNNVSHMDDLTTVKYIQERMSEDIRGRGLVNKRIVAEHNREIKKESEEVLEDDEYWVID